LPSVDRPILPITSFLADDFPYDILGAIDTTVAQTYNYPHVSKDMTIEGMFSCKQASHFWPGGGNSSTAPLPIYEKGLSLNTGDRMHTTMHQSQEEYTIMTDFRQLLATL
jgi:hypothetical protein